MKKFHIIISVFFFIISCNKDNGLVLEPEIEVDESENIITTPCSFNISTVEANSTIVIDCLLDLKGKEIQLPSNVNFDFKGGDIINGKLIFSGGKIDGRLLNYRLKVEGDVSLKGVDFKFYASRWNIKEGITSSNIALQNTKKLEDVLFFIKKLGGDVFNIDKLDAYFEVTKVTSTTTNANWYPTLEAINLPSNFSLVMTDSTHLRIFPGDKHRRNGGAILAVRDAENIKIIGGNFHGDRDERVFSADDDGLEGSHLFYIHSGRNITVDGVNFENGSAGTFAIFSFGFSFNSNYNPTQNITIKNCVIKNSRRMAIALTDGRDILIENNTFINAGQPSVNTDGGEVGYAINIEPDRYRDTNGVLKERQKVFDVIIKNNTERGSRGGFLTLTIGQDITVENNNIGTRVVSSLISGAKIINNKFKALGKAVDSWAIFIAGSGETVYNNEIANNTIEGYSAGIIVGSYGAYIHDNSIKACKAGIQLSKAKKTRIYNNTIDVLNNGIQATNTYSEEVEIKGNTVKTSGNYNVYFAQFNHNLENHGNTVVFDNNNFENDKSLIFSNTAGVVFKSNTVKGGVFVGKSWNVEISDNKIQPNKKDGIKLKYFHENVSILDNVINKPMGGTQYECIINDSDSPNAITLTNNICN